MKGLGGCNSAIRDIIVCQTLFQECNFWKTSRNYTGRCRIDRCQAQIFCEITSYLRFGKRDGQHRTR